MEPSCNLPPGFRFHPTDEELINYYLTKKVLDSTFSVRSIVDIDVNHSEPWDFRGKAKLEEKEWYFFTLRDRKYPTGTRTNRATEAGYWKATGKDREVVNSQFGSIVGMKKTLVFYRGRAPKGEKTNWIMHEYRLEGAASHIQFTKVANEAEWVVCRIFQKRVGGKKACLKNINLMNFSEGGQLLLPPLNDYPQQTAAEDLEGDSDTNIQGDHVGYQSIVLGQQKSDNVTKVRRSNNSCVAGMNNYLRDGNASISSNAVEKLMKGPYSIQRIQQYSVERETMPTNYTCKVERYVDGTEMEGYRLVDKSAWLQGSMPYEDTQSLLDVKLPSSSPLMESFCEEVPPNLYRADISSTEDLDCFLG